MCNKLNNKARSNNPIKSAAFSVKQNASSNSNNNNTPRGDCSYRSRDLGRGGRRGRGGGGVNNNY
jgi:hypothetical protein